MIFRYKISLQNFRHRPQGILDRPCYPVNPDNVDTVVVIFQSFQYIFHSIFDGFKRHEMTGWCWCCRFRNCRERQSQNSFPSQWHPSFYWYLLLACSYCSVKANQENSKHRSICGSKSLVLHCPDFEPRWLYYWLLAANLGLHFLFLLYFFLPAQLNIWHASATAAFSLCAWSLNSFMFSV